jgi:hypothetical protein
LLFGLFQATLKMCHKRVESKKTVEQGAGKSFPNDHHARDQADEHTESTTPHKKKSYRMQLRGYPATWGFTPYPTA